MSVRHDTPEPLGPQGVGRHWDIGHMIVCLVWGNGFSHHGNQRRAHVGSCGKFGMTTPTNPRSHTEPTSDYGLISSAPLWFSSFTLRGLLCDILKLQSNHYSGNDTNNNPNSSADGIRFNLVFTVGLLQFA